jgi:hypothetical protein
MPRSPDPLIVIEVCVDSLESATAFVYSKYYLFWVEFAKRIID